MYGRLQLPPVELMIGYLGVRLLALNVFLFEKKKEKIKKKLRKRELSLKIKKKIVAKIMRFFFNYYIEFIFQFPVHLNLGKFLKFLPFMAYALNNF